METFQWSVSTKTSKFLIKKESISGTYISSGDQPGALAWEEFPPQVFRIWAVFFESWFPVVLEETASAVEDLRSFPWSEGCRGWWVLTTWARLPPRPHSLHLGSAKKKKKCHMGTLHSQSTWCSAWRNVMSCPQIETTVACFCVHSQCSNISRSSKWKSFHFSCRHALPHASRVLAGRTGKSQLRIATNVPLSRELAVCGHSDQIFCVLPGCQTDPSKSVPRKARTANFQKALSLDVGLLPLPSASQQLNNKNCYSQPPSGIHKCTIDNITQNSLPFRTPHWPQQEDTINREGNSIAMLKLTNWRGSRGLYCCARFVLKSRRPIDATSERPLSPPHHEWENNRQPMNWATPLVEIVDTFCWDSCLSWRDFRPERGVFPDLLRPRELKAPNSTGTKTPSSSTNWGTDCIWFFAKFKCFSLEFTLQSNNEYQMICVVRREP